MTTSRRGGERCEAISVDTLEDGPRVESGPGQEARTEEPRHGVIVQATEGKTVVYWGTPQMQEALEAQAWPGVPRERNERHAHRINSGRPQRLGAARPQQRTQAHRAQSLETAHKQVDKKAEALKAQQDQVAEAASTGHGQRLEQRRRTVLPWAQAGPEAPATPAQCSAHAATLGPAGQRADRDFRPQTILTICTLLRAQGRRAFMGALSATRSTKGSVPQVLRRLCERSGSRLETPSQVLSWVNSGGVSLANRRLWSEGAQGLCAMGFQEKGKPVHVRLPDLPP